MKIDSFLLCLPYLTLYVQNYSTYPSLHCQSSEGWRRFFWAQRVLSFPFHRPPPHSYLLGHLKENKSPALTVKSIYDTCQIFFFLQCPNILSESFKTGKSVETAHHTSQGHSSPQWYFHAGPHSTRVPPYLRQGFYSGSTQVWPLGWNPFLCWVPMPFWRPKADTFGRSW